MTQRLPLINLITYVGLVIINFLALQLPFFGKRPGDVSDLYFNLLTPPDFSFRIWSVIYLLLGLFTFFQSKPLFNKKETVSKEVSAIGFLFLLTSLLNVAWLVTWQSLHITMAFLLMLPLWILLIVINYRLTMLETARWMYTIPFSMYLAWMCIAALGNLNIMLMDNNLAFLGFGDEYWTAAWVIMGVLGTLLVLYLNQDLWFTLVLIWAFFGIYTKNVEISNGDNLVVSASLFAMIFLLIIGTWIGWKKWKRREISA